MVLMRILWLLPILFMWGCGPKEYDTPLINEGVDTRVDDSSCQTDLQFVANQAWPKILSQCTACHNTQGLAGNTGYVLQNLRSEAQDHIDVSYTYESDHPGVIISKALGQSHGGGTLMLSGSTHHDTLAEFVSRFDNPITNCGDNTIPTSTLDARALSTKLSITTPSSTLRQAALLLAGTLPTDAQLSAVTESNLKATLRSLMSGHNFKMGKRPHTGLGGSKW